MARFLTKRVLLIRLLIPALIAVALAFTLWHFLKGPVLGEEFDYLSQKRPQPPIASEILIINIGNKEDLTDKNVISPAIACSIMETLTEMSASNLIIQTPVLGISYSSPQSSTELLYRFEDEFNIINGNVKNLFEGIKTGAIEPAEAETFVNDVVQLNDEGKKRLLRSTLRTSDEELRELEKVFQVFGNAEIQRGVELSIISHKNENKGEMPNISALYSSTYSEGVFDEDGKIRRVIPFITIDSDKNIYKEHIAYAALKRQFPGRDWSFHTDENGALIFERPKTGMDAAGQASAFREIPLHLFIEYYDLDKTLYKLLADSVSLSSYGGILPDKYPSFLYENAEKIQNLLFSEDEDNEGAAAEPDARDTKALKTDWIAARKEYFSALARFFSGVVENDIYASYNKLIEEEKAENTLSEAGAQKLLSIRDGELKKYHIAKEVYNELQKIRNLLERNLKGSFCILGETDLSADVLGSADISALLANSLLTGNSIEVEPKNGVLFYSFIALGAAAILTFFLPPSATFFIGILLSALAWFVFAERFIQFGVWLDPVIPAAAAFSAAFASYIIALIARASMSASLKRTFGAIMPREKLIRLIKSRKALPEDYKTVRSTVVAIYNSDFKKNSVDNSFIAAKIYKKFTSEVSEVFIEGGALIISSSSDTVLAVFDSPLDEIIQKKSFLAKLLSDGDGGEGSKGKSPKNSVLKAAKLISELPEDNTRTGRWLFGLDFGECTYLRSPTGTYTAQGKVIDRAIELSRLCVDYDVKAIASMTAANKLINFPLRALPPPPPQDSQEPYEESLLFEIG